MIAALLLAAGRGTRFGGDKLLAPLADKSVVRWSAEAVSRAVDGTWVVIAPDADGVRRALAGMDVRFVSHAGRDEGMASSIRVGIAALSPAVRAVIIALGDQPLVGPEVIARLVARWRDTGAPAVVPRYRDGRGHPVLFDRACFPALALLTGDAGARPVLTSLGDGLAFLDVDEPMPMDVDTPAALAALEASLREESAEPN